MANREHLEILLRGVEEWNAWRGEHPEIKPDLGRANLQYANLKDAYFQYANLQGAKLQGADLQYVRLQYANFQGAKLNHAQNSTMPT